MENDVKEYYKKILEQWHNRFPLRNPLFCVKLNCIHLCLPSESKSYFCKLIEKSNKKVQDGIDDFESAKERHKRKENNTGEKWILDSFLRNPKNVYLSTDDLFPEHLVHPSCPHFLDHLMKSGIDE